MTLNHNSHSLQTFSTSTSSSFLDNMFFKSIVAAAASLATLSAAAPTAHRASGEVIPGSYIIRLKDNVKTDTHLSWANGIHARSAGKDDFSGILREFKGHSFHGYSGHFDKDTIAKIDASDEVRIHHTCC